MSFTKLIEDQTRQAFVTMGDLVTSVILRSTTSVSYEFGTTNSDGIVTHLTEDLITSALIEETLQKENPEDFGVKVKTVSVLTTDLDDPSLYDKVIIKGKIHNVVSFVSDVALVVLTVTEE